MITLQKKVLLKSPNHMQLIRILTYNALGQYQLIFNKLNIFFIFIRTPFLESTSRQKNLPEIELY